MRVYRITTKQSYEYYKFQDSNIKAFAWRPISLHLLDLYFASGYLALEKAEKSLRNQVFIDKIMSFAI